MLYLVGSMLRYNRIDSSVFQPLPQRDHVLLGTQWRAYFIITVKAPYQLISHHQMMRRHVASYLASFGFSSPDQSDTFSGTDGGEVYRCIIIFSEVQITGNHQRFGEVRISLHAEVGTGCTFIHFSSRGNRLVFGPRNDETTKSFGI